MPNVQRYHPHHVSQFPFFPGVAHRSSIPNEALPSRYFLARRFFLSFLSISCVRGFFPPLLLCRSFPLPLRSSFLPSLPFHSSLVPSSLYSTPSFFPSLSSPIPRSFPPYLFSLTSFPPLPSPHFLLPLAPSSRWPKSY